MSKSGILKDVVRRWDNLLPPSKSHAATATKLFQREARLSWSADSLIRLPPPVAPEIVFLGRSNVGKSSLLNALLHRRSSRLARTSKSAGKTQCLNGYTMQGGGGGQPLCLVDTPGYGHGSRMEWGPMIMQYIARRSSLKRVMLLIEASHGFKSTDEQLVQELARRGVPFQVLLTKVDKLSVQDTSHVLEYTETYLKKVGRAAVWGEVIGLSSGKHATGLLDLRCSVAYAAGLLPPRYSEASNASPKFYGKAGGDQTGGDQTRPHNANDYTKAVQGKTRESEQSAATLDSRQEQSDDQAFEDVPIIRPDSTERDQGGPLSRVMNG